MWQKWIHCKHQSSIPNYSSPTENLLCLYFLVIFRQLLSTEDICDLSLKASNTLSPFKQVYTNFPSFLRELETLLKYVVIDFKSLK